MGGGTFDFNDWTRYSARTASKPVSEVFTSSGLKDYLDPKKIVVRESRDSADHPASTAIIFANDVTGSMGIYAKAVAVSSLGILFKELLDRKPVPDPQMMFMGVGDAAMHDRFPLQVSQFESDNRVIDQLADLYIEGGGGGNDSESYTLPWYFAATKTSIDCFEKRGKKGYLFTSGDECCPATLGQKELTKVFGPGQYQDYTAKELLHMAQKMYHVFHIVIEQGSFASSRLGVVKNSWSEVLGQNVLYLSDHTKLAEVVVSTIQVMEGEDKDKVVKSWSGDTSLVVAKTLGSLTAASKTTGGVVRL